MNKQQFIEDMNTMMENISAEDATKVMDIVMTQLVTKFWREPDLFLNKLQEMGVTEDECVPAIAVLSKLIVDEFIKKDTNVVVANLGAAIVSGRYLSNITHAEFNLHSNPLIQSSIQLHVKRCLIFANENQDRLVEYMKNTWLASQQKLDELKGGIKN